MRKLVLLAGACLLLLVPTACSKSDGGGDASASIPLTKADGKPLAKNTAGYEAALAKGLTSGKINQGDLVLKPAEARCVAQAWVPILRVERLRSKQVTIDALEDPKFNYATFGLSDPEAHQMVAAFTTCKVDVKTQMAVSLAGGKKGKASACIHDKVDDALMDKILFTALTQTQATKSVAIKVDKIVRSCGAA